MGFCASDTVITIGFWRSMRSYVLLFSEGFGSYGINILQRLPITMLLKSFLEAFFAPRDFLGLVYRRH